MQRFPLSSLGRICESVPCTQDLRKATGDHNQPYCFGHIETWHSF